MGDINYWKYWLFIVGLFLISDIAVAQWPLQMIDDVERVNWVDSVYDQMTVEERLGQLLMIRAHSNKNEDHIREVERLIREYHVGALCFFQGNPSDQARLTNQYQQLAKYPMLVAIDAEWGLGMRFKEDGISFPRQLTLGALRNNNLIYSMGEEIARQLREIGVHINFAPVIDVNNNPANPVINDRSFGEVKEWVTVKGNAYMRGLQESGVMACGKHFPGHGDTDVDSHYDLPVIHHDVERMDSVELYPFRKLIPQGLQSIMIAHLQIPAFDDTPNLPTTLSKKVVTNLLKNEMRFKGLIISDAMEMKGVTKYFPAGEAELKAFLAGNDIICLPADVPMAFNALVKSWDDGLISPERLEESVKKILSAKYHVGLGDYNSVPLEGLKEKVNRPSGLALKAELIENAITLVRDEQNMFPLELEVDKRRLTLAIGSSSKNSFQKRLDDYGEWEHHSMSQGQLKAEYSRLKSILCEADQLVISLHNMDRFLSKNYGLNPSTLRIVNEIAQNTEVVLVVFGSPYSLRYFDDLQTVLVAYEDDEVFRDVAAQGIGGAFAISGVLPVTASEKSRAGMGINIPSQFRFGFVLPERMGLSSDTLALIDKLVDEMISGKAAPGCQILVAKNGKVVYRRSFGYHTYDKKTKVEDHHVYDLASLTKTLATTYSTMVLFDKGEVNIFNDLIEYLPELQGTNKANLEIHDIMVHKAGLKSWIPFYRETVQRTRGNVIYNPDVYHSGPSHEYPLQVSDGLWINSAHQDVVWEEIVNSPLGRSNRYVYSDLGFYILARLIQNVSGQPLDVFSHENVFKPLGLYRTLFNPLSEIAPDEIVPSEKDNYFRQQVLRGFVHDMGAAMLGGVSGHAGLFSNSHEVGIIMQSFLNGGFYGGSRIVDPLAINLFTSRPQMESRRGIGFDMKQLNQARRPNMSEMASYRTFGHLGFTGTVAWADPEHQLIYVMLSNRTFPTMENRRLISENYRIRIQDIIYRSIIKDTFSGA